MCNIHSEFEIARIRLRFWTGSKTALIMHGIGKGARKSKREQQQEAASEGGELVLALGNNCN